MLVPNKAVNRRSLPTICMFVSLVVVGVSTFALLALTIENRTTSAYYDYFTPKKWEKFNGTEHVVTYRASQADLDSALVSGAKTQVQTAVAHWNPQLTGAAFRLQEVAGTADIDIVAINFDTFFPLLWSGTPGITTWSPEVGGPLTYSVAWLNKQLTWNTTGTMNSSAGIADVRTVVLHELGHTIGWRHKEDPNCDSTGGPGKVLLISPMCVKLNSHSWFTQADDRLGMRTKYGMP